MAAFQTSFLLLRVKKSYPATKIRIGMVNFSTIPPVKERTPFLHPETNSMHYNYFMIFFSIFCFGVSAGLVLSGILSNRGLHKSRRKNLWGL